MQQTISPFSLVVFGATGDLTRRKLIPAFFNLYLEGFLPKHFQIIGFSRRNISSEEFKQLLYHSVSQLANFSKDKWNEFSKNISYFVGNFEDIKAYQRIKNTLEDYDKKMSEANKMLYLATPPQHYETILDGIIKSGLTKRASAGYWTKVLIEKPFGKDLNDAKKLDQMLSKFLSEDQIYRVDHYLGKETVQNIIAFRFANGIFEPIWNNNYIDHVQITLAEKEGIGTRGNFYDGVGALRDITQNHIMQLIAMVAMEQPVSFSADGVRAARAKAIEAITCVDSNEVNRYVVRGQYQGYSQEKNVSANSKTETFVAMKLFVNTPRFKGIPFYVRTGKRLLRNCVEISLVFKQVCHILFKEVGCPEEGNVLTIRIQPEEGIAIRFIAKEPGSVMKLTPINMDFTYKEAFKTKEIDAYQRILQDAFLGDQMLFNRSDELVSSWAFITRILEGWSRGYGKLYLYSGGTLGPEAAQELIKRDGRRWIL